MMSLADGFFLPSLGLATLFFHVNLKNFTHFLRQTEANKFTQFSLRDTILNLPSPCFTELGILVSVFLRRTLKISFSCRWSARDLLKSTGDLPVAPTDRTSLFSPLISLLYCQRFDCTVSLMVSEVILVRADQIWTFVYFFK